MTSDRPRLLAMLTAAELDLCPALAPLAARARRGTRAELPEWRTCNTTPMVVRDAGKRRARQERWRRRAA